MSMNRRDILAGSAAIAAAAGLPGSASAQAKGILKVIPHASLTTLDPVATTGYIVRNHGYMIWDTLFAMNEKLEVQPQMVAGRRQVRDFPFLPREPMAQAVLLERHTVRLVKARHAEAILVELMTPWNCV